MVINMATIIIIVCVLINAVCVGCCVKATGNAERFMEQDEIKRSEKNGDTLHN